MSRRRLTVPEMFGFYSVNASHCWHRSHFSATFTRRAGKMSVSGLKNSPAAPHFVHSLQQSTKHQPEIL
jgi:hypothetical protein